ncbi:hypothetical protein GR927_36215 [Mycolicibacterium sp. 3033]|nr:hypothetical protein [Mycolicibacterium aurantiacum]
MPEVHDRRSLRVLVIAGQHQLEAVAGGEAPGVGHQRDAIGDDLPDRHRHRGVAAKGRRAGAAVGVGVGARAATLIEAAAVAPVLQRYIEQDLE